MTSVTFRFYRLIILKVGKTNFVALITKTVEMTPRGVAAKAYKVQDGIRITVPTDQLLPKSNVRIEASCDVCGRIVEIMYADYRECCDTHNGMYVCRDKSAHKMLNVENDLKRYKQLILEFRDQYGRFPVIADFPLLASSESYMTVMRAFNGMGQNYRDFRASTDPHSAFSKENYDIYKAEYLRIMQESDPPCSMSYVYKRAGKRKLPTATWMVKNCPNKKVKSTYDWLSWVGYLQTRNMTKAIAKDLILKLSRKYKRPLMYDDFRKRQPDRPPIPVIIKYWGSLNEMKRDLGLEIIQENMVERHLSDEDMISAIASACQEISTTRGDNLIATQDLTESSLCPASQTINAFVKEKFGVTLTEYIQSLGYRTIEPGRGLSRVDEFGERFESRYEELFSLYLQSIGLGYLNHYHRSVKYSDICGSDCGARNCDYRIEYNGRTIYIEIAGILGQYKQFYIDNRQITSSQSRERYRVKLMEKEAMLIAAGVEYFILFPCDLSHDILGFIFNGAYSEAKSLIHSHYKNNIHWKNIDPERGVEYDWTRIGRDGQPRVVV